MYGVNAVRGRLGTNAVADEVANSSSVRARGEWRGRPTRR